MFWYYIICLVSSIFSASILSATMSDDEQAALPAPGDEQAAESTSEFVGKIWFKVHGRGYINVVPHYLEIAGVPPDPGDTPCYPVHEILSNEFGKRLIFCLLRETFDFVRNSTAIKKFALGCFQFELSCFTKGSFEEIIKYPIDKIEKRLEEEFRKVGMEHTGLMVEIVNKEVE